MTASDSGFAGLPTSTGALYRAALGPAGARIHLPEMARFEERGRSGTRWCAPAALQHLAWLVYWRLWDVALALAALTVVGAGALGWLWQRADGVPLGVRAGLTIIAFALWWTLPAFWGLAWLHRGLRERVALAVSEADTLEGALESLRRSESAWWWPGVVVAAAAVVVTVGLAWTVWHWWRVPVASLAPIEAVSPPAPVSAPAVSASPVPATPSPPPVVASAPPVTPAPSAPTAEGPAIKVTNQVRPRVQGYGVNVGMFAVPTNADRVQARLTQAGLPVLAAPVESARGPLTRVRVGPYEQREQAEAAARKVKALGLEALVYAP